MLASGLFPPVCLLSAVLTVQLRQLCSAQAVREGAQSPSREEFPQTAGPDVVCAQHPPVLPTGTVHTASVRM